MAEALEAIEEQGLVVHTAPGFQMDDRQLLRFCQINRELQIERNAEGDLVFMAPESGGSGSANSELNFQLRAWARQEGGGRVFGSSAGFILPNRAMRAPDAAWVRNERLARLSDEDWNGFLPLCPDFVAELRSPSDSLGALGHKMEEYLRNGTELGWLLDPPSRTVHVYTPGRPVEILRDPATLSGEPLLRGFILQVREVWAATLPPKRG